MAAETVGKISDKKGSSPAKQKSAPLISRKLLLFMVAMVLANTGGNMYGPLLPAGWLIKKDTVCRSCLVSFSNFWL